MGFNAQKVANRKRTKRNAPTKPEATAEPVAAAPKPALSVREVVARRRAARTTEAAKNGDPAALQAMLAQIQAMMAKGQPGRDAADGEVDADEDAAAAELDAMLLNDIEAGEAKLAMDKVQIEKLDRLVKGEADEAQVAAEEGTVAAE
ncbi:hypothetical protein H9P43_006896 [Blastocladiella emersonii ATCC 22665]|nr:hypothetical protein H9P43_006896 [Blastocladiella emersonii ATCC 22665]